MTTRTGRIETHLDVSGDLTVMGTVEAGATVHPGASLTVNGSMEGPLIVHERAVVSVQGVVSGDVRLLGGLLLVAGLWEGDLLEREGRLGFAVGTLIDEKVVADDGALVVPAEDADGNVTIYATLNNDSFRFLTDGGTLVRKEDLISEMREDT